MTPKKFARRLIVKIVVFTTFMFTVSTIMSFISPVISNQLAMGQMQNSNEAFVTWNVYNNLKPIAQFAYIGISLWFTSTIARDTYKFIKNLKEKH